MQIKQCHVLFFSPCGGTAKVGRALVADLRVPVQEDNLTLPVARKARRHFDAEDLVLLVFPVYGGRLPWIAEEIFALLHGTESPTVLAAVYGNRDYEDTLLEMTHLAEQRGLRPVGAVAAVAEHSLLAELAAGRPDDGDCRMLAKAVADMVKGLAARALPATGSFIPPGEFPYRKPAMKLPFGPEVAEELCTQCRVCAALCPTAAIPPEAPGSTLLDRCLACQACVKFCPEGARSMAADKIEPVRHWLRETCIKRREVEIFLPAAG